MRRLRLFGLIVGVFLAGDVTLASMYVPGQYKDGIYIRPHFRPAPGQIFDHQTPLEAEKGLTGRVPAKPAGLEDSPPEKKLSGDTPS